MTPIRTLKALALAGILASALLLAGCGGTVIDDVKAEDAIQANLEESLERQIDSVDCPSDQDVEPKATFDCAVRFGDGEQATVTMRIDNEEADLSLVDLEANE